MDAPGCVAYADACITYTHCSRAYSSNGMPISETSCVTCLSLSDQTWPPFRYLYQSSDTSKNSRGFALDIGLPSSHAHASCPPSFFVVDHYLWCILLGRDSSTTLRLYCCRPTEPQ